jgi:formylglycine-generating enzyme required for sulfatase activity
MLLTFVILLISTKQSFGEDEGECGCSKSRESMSEGNIQQGSCDGLGDKPDLGLEGGLSSVERSTIDIPDILRIESPTVFIPGGRYTKGWQKPEGKGEGEFWTSFVPHPLDKEDVTVEEVGPGFWIDVHETSNEDYYQYLSWCTTNKICSSYTQTMNEYNDTFVFLPNFRAAEGGSGTVLDSHEVVSWWGRATGVTWNNPFGNLTGVVNGGNSKSGLQAPTRPEDSMLLHPVVHVSKTDAEHYCAQRTAWDNERHGTPRGVTRLPTEVEWEYASRGGKEGRVYPWGNKERKGEEGVYRANYFQGTFPEMNTVDDGWEQTSPRGSFGPQNAYGLHDMVGNVWEWTSTAGGDGYVKKGGSFLCHSSYCYRYRNAARSFNSGDTTAANLGFRCVSSGGTEDEGA